jgi:hypothetical protein
MKRSISDVLEFNLVMPQTFYIRSGVLALRPTIPRILPIDNEFKKVILAIFWDIGLYLNSHMEEPA